MDRYKKFQEYRQANKHLQRDIIPWKIDCLEYYKGKFLIEDMNNYLYSREKELYEKINNNEISYQEKDLEMRKYKVIAQKEYDKNLNIFIKDLKVRRKIQDLIHFTQEEEFRAKGRMKEGEGIIKLSID